MSAERVIFVLYHLLALSILSPICGELEETNEQGAEKGDRRKKIEKDVYIAEERVEERKDGSE